MCRQHLHRISHAHGPDSLREDLYRTRQPRPDLPGLVPRSIRSRLPVLGRSWPFSSALAGEEPLRRRTVVVRPAVRQNLGTRQRCHFASSPSTRTGPVIENAEKNDSSSRASSSYFARPRSAVACLRKASASAGPSDERSWVVIYLEIRASDEAIVSRASAAARFTESFAKVKKPCSSSSPKI